MRQRRSSAAAAERRRHATAATIVRGMSSTANRASDVLDEGDDLDAEWELNDAAIEALQRGEAALQRMEAHLSAAATQSIDTIEVPPAQTRQ